jgi:hypothetical protein
MDDESVTTSTGSMVYSGGWTSILFTHGWVACILSIALLLAWKRYSVNFVGAQLPVFFVTAKDVGSVVDDGDRVMGSSQCEPMTCKLSL